MCAVRMFVAVQGTLTLNKIECCANPPLRQRFVKFIETLKAEKKGFTERLAFQSVKLMQSSDRRARACSGSPLLVLFSQCHHL